MATLLGPLGARIINNVRRFFPPQGTRGLFLVEEGDRLEPWIGHPSGDLDQLGYANTRLTKIFRLADPRYGITGEGEEDDTLGIQQALQDASDAGGGLVVGEPTATYLVTDDLIVPTNAKFFLNGATLLLEYDGNKYGILLRDDTALEGGTIDLTGVNLAASGGQFHCPVVVGDFVNNIGYDGVSIKKLEITSDRTDGNGIFITGDSKRFEIEDIYFPSSNTLGRGILVHWASDGASPYPALTTHPGNGIIRNITAGEMLYASAATAVVYLSATYNIRVNNVKCQRIGGRGPVAYAAGDLGFYYADAETKKLAHQANVFDGVVCPHCDNFGYQHDSWADNLASPEIVSTPVTIRNFRCQGTGTAHTVAGLRASKSVDLIAENCEFTHFMDGAEIDESSKRVKIIGGRYNWNNRHGVTVHHAGQPPRDISIKGIEAKLNGRTSSGGCINIGASYRTIAEDNLLGDEVNPGSELAIWGIRTDGAVKASLIRNKVLALVAGGVCYSISAAATDEIWEFHGNEGAAGFTYRAGQTWLPTVRGPMVGTLHQADYVGTGSPEGVLTAAMGSRAMRTDGGASTTLYIKTSGTGNTGWTAK